MADGQGRKSIAVMQPYLLPYIGYFQLINAVDEFIIFDDATYINRGWINRNNILLEQRAHRFTLEVMAASQNRAIKMIQLGGNKYKVLETIRHAYSKAPMFPDVFPLLEKIFAKESIYLVEFTINSLKNICNYLGLNAHFKCSSELNIRDDGDRSDRIIDICKQRGAAKYINPIGGAALYDRGYFSERGVALFFIESENIRYKQFGNQFIANLSIIDLLMFNSITEAKKQINNYHLCRDLIG